MPEILINDFSPGQYSQPADTDIPNGAAQLAKNVDLRDFGKLQKLKGRLEFLDSLPTGTIFSKPFEFEFTKPSSKQCVFLHVRNSGRNELWWRPYWNPATSAWVDDWQELTEFEGPLTIDAGSNTTTIVDAALASSTDDYYNGWIAVNITRQAASEVYDYDGGTNTITLRDAIASQTTGDTVYLYRYSLMMPLEGPYTADSGTDTTTIVDTELRAPNDDHYVGWTLVNTTRSDSATVTAYNAKTQTITLDSAIASQTSTDAYYLYKTDHDIGADELNIVRFFPRENAVEISVGNTYGFPTQAPLWFGWIPKRVFLDQDGSDTVTDTTVEQFWLCRNVLDRPDVSVFALSDQGSGTLTDDSFYVRLRYVYDGYQIGPASSSENLDVNGNAIDIDLQIGMWLNNSSNKPSLFEAVLNKRITALQVEVAEGATNHNKDNYYLYAEVQLVNIQPTKFGYPIGVTFNIWTRTSDLYDSVTLSLEDAIWTNSGASQLNGVVVTKGLRWDIRVGHKSTRVDCNYKFRATLDNIHFKAPVFTDIKRDTFVQYSVQATGDGVPADDVVPLLGPLGLIDIGPRGATEITGLVSFGGFLWVLTPRKIFKYAPGLVFDDVITETGCIAPDSVVVTDDGFYFVGHDDFYFFNGIKPQRLMYGRVLDAWDSIAVTDRGTCRADYFKNKDVIYLWLVNNTLYIYDIIQNNWTQATTENEYMFSGVDGELYGSHLLDGVVYEFEASSYTDTLSMQWTSKVFDFVKEVAGQRIPTNARIKRFIIKHSGDQELQFDFYDKSRSSSVPRRTVTFPPQSNDKQVVRELELEAEQIYFDMTENDQGGSAPSHSIDWMKIVWEPVGY